MSYSTRSKRSRPASNTSNSTSEPSPWHTASTSRLELAGHRDAVVHSSATRAFEEVEFPTNVRSSPPRPSTSQHTRTSNSPLKVSSGSSSAPSSGSSANKDDILAAAKDEIRGREFCSTYLGDFFTADREGLRVPEENLLIEAVRKTCETIHKDSTRGESSAYGVEDTMKEFFKLMEQGFGARFSAWSRNMRRLVVAGSSLKPVKTDAESDLHDSTQQPRSQNPPDLVLLSNAAMMESSDFESLRASYEGREISEAAYWQSVMAVGECKKKSKDKGEARDQILRRLHELQLTPIRTHGLGFTITGNVLIIMALTPMGLFTSSTIKLDDFETLPRFFIRLLSLSDLKLGRLIVRKSNPSNGKGNVCLRLPELVQELGLASIIHESPLFDTVNDVDIHLSNIAFGRIKCTGRCTSAFEAHVSTEPANVQRAVSVSFADENRLIDQDSVRRLVQKESKKGRIAEIGLSSVVLVLRGTSSFKPCFIDKQDGESENVARRRIEITVHEQFLQPLTKIKSTLHLVKANLNVVKALHFLQSHGWIHRDISRYNILLDGDGNARLIDYDLTAPLKNIQILKRERSGTTPYMAISLLPQLAPIKNVSSGEEQIPQSCWHDLESLLYVNFELAFIVNLVTEKTESKLPGAAVLWKYWSNKETAAMFKRNLIGEDVRDAAIANHQEGWDAVMLQGLMVLLSKHCIYAAWDGKSKIKVVEEETARRWALGSMEEGLQKEQKLEQGQWSTESMGFKKLIDELEVFITKYEV